MAKGKQKAQARIAAVNLLGKDLARRACRACELCESREDCRPYDFAPDDEPTLDTLLLACGRCRDRLDRPGQTPPDHLRDVANHCWTDSPPLRQAVLTLLEPIQEDWARDAVEQAKMMAGIGE